MSANPAATATATAPGGWLLALHSATDTLGVGLQRLPVEGSPQNADEPARLASFPLGRELSNRLFACIEELLPAGEWARLARLAVCTGPGGFTGTRLTVVFARTLAQQLRLPLDGVSSFHLIARRLAMDSEHPPALPFWLVRELPRHGQVAGLYAVDPSRPGGIEERLAPGLFRNEEEWSSAAAAASVPDCPRLPAEPMLPADVGGLLAVSIARRSLGAAAAWQTVLPLYPTSPVRGA